MYKDGFNPRAREGRDGQRLIQTTQHSGFNPRAREGRDFNVGAYLGPWTVSIHAPVKGATNQF